MTERCVNSIRSFFSCFCFFFSFLFQIIQTQSNSSCPTILRWIFTSDWLFSTKKKITSLAKKKKKYIPRVSRVSPTRSYSKLFFFLFLAKFSSSNPTKTPCLAKLITSSCTIKIDKKKIWICTKRQKFFSFIKISPFTTHLLTCEYDKNYCNYKKTNKRCLY